VPQPKNKNKSKNKNVKLMQNTTFSEFPLAVMKKQVVTAKMEVDKLKTEAAAAVEMEEMMAAVAMSTTTWFGYTTAMATATDEAQITLEMANEEAVMTKEAAARAAMTVVKTTTTYKKLLVKYRWLQVRYFIKLRTYALKWQEYVQERLCAPDGVGRKVDLVAFETDFVKM